MNLQFNDPTHTVQITLEGVRLHVTVSGPTRNDYVIDTIEPVDSDDLYYLITRQITDDQLATLIGEELKEIHPW